MPEDNRRRLGDEFSGLLSAIAATDAVRPLAEATMGVFRDSEQLRQVHVAGPDRVLAQILPGFAVG